MKELISIIVPIYNVEQYLNKCVNSLLNQTYKNIEIFLVDDGSPDNCPKMCDELKKKDKRIVVIHKENGGYGSVLEYAINNIKGKYFIICDPDDWLEDNAIEILLEKMKKNKVDIVIGGKYLVYNDGKKEDKSDYDYRVLKPNKVYIDLNDFIYIPPSPHSKLYKTEIAKKIKFPKKVSYTDLLLYFVYLSYAKKGYFVNNNLSNYFIDRPGNTMTDYNEKLSINSIKSVVTVRNEIINQINSDSNIKNDILGWLGMSTLKVIAKIFDDNREEIKDYYYQLINIMIKIKVYKKNIKKYNRIVSDNKLKSMFKNIFVDLFYFVPTRKIALKIYKRKIKD